MASALKCPNPGCPYLFDPTGVPAGVVLTCPRCGMRFTLGPTVPATQVPPQQPVERPDPSFEAIEKHPASESDPRPPSQRTFQDRADPGGPKLVFWTIFTIAILLGAGVTVYFQAFHNKSAEPHDPATRLKDCNLAFDPPPAPWERDSAMEVKLGPPFQLVYKRSDPEAYIAIGAAPNDDREPRLSELKDGLNKPLGKVFGAENLGDPKPIEGGVTWLGIPARPVFSFTVSHPDATKTSGEAFAVSHKGVAYWCLCWAGELEFPRLAPEFDALRGRFRVLKERDNWQPKEAQITTYGGHAAKYTLLDADGIWTEDNHPEQQVPPADLYLVGKIKRPGTDRFDRQPTAEVWAYVIDNPGGDPLAAAQKHVESLRTAEVNGGGSKYNVTFDVLAGDPEGDAPTDPVEQSSPVVRLKSSVKESRDQSRLIVVSGAAAGNKLIVVRAQCDFIDRSFFEPKLMQLAGSLRVNP